MKYGLVRPESFAVWREILARVQNSSNPEATISEITSRVPDTQVMSPEWMAGEIRKDIPIDWEKAAAPGGTLEAEELDNILSRAEEYPTDIDRDTAFSGFSPEITGYEAGPPITAEGPVPSGRGTQLKIENLNRSSRANDANKVDTSSLPVVDKLAVVNSSDRHSRLTDSGDAQIQSEVSDLNHRTLYLDENGNRDLGKFLEAGKAVTSRAYGSTEAAMDQLSTLEGNDLGGPIRSALNGTNAMAQSFLKRIDESITPGKKFIKTAPEVLIANITRSMAENVFANIQQMELAPLLKSLYDAWGEDFMTGSAKVGTGKAEKIYRNDVPRVIDKIIMEKANLDSNGAKLLRLVNGKYEGTWVDFVENRHLYSGTLTPEQESSLSKWKTYMDNLTSEEMRWGLVRKLWVDSRDPRNLYVPRADKKGEDVRQEIAQNSDTETFARENTGVRSWTTAFEHYADDLLSAKYTDPEISIISLLSKNAGFRKRSVGRHVLEYGLNTDGNIRIGSKYKILSSVARQPRLEGSKSASLTNARDILDNLDKARKDISELHQQDYVLLRQIQDRNKWSVEEGRDPSERPVWSNPEIYNLLKKIEENFGSGNSVINARDENSTQIMSGIPADVITGYRQLQELYHLSIRVFDPDLIAGRAERLITLAKNLDEATKVFNSWKPSDYGYVNGLNMWMHNDNHAALLSLTQARRLPAKGDDIVRFVNEVDQTVLSSDASALFYQLMTANAARPIRAFTNLFHLFIGDDWAKENGRFLRFTEKGLIEWYSTTEGKKRAEDMTVYVGIAFQATTIEETGTGFGPAMIRGIFKLFGVDPVIGMVTKGKVRPGRIIADKYERINSSLYRMIFMNIDNYFHNEWTGLVRMGMPETEAKATAAEIVRLDFARMTGESAIRGVSDLRASRERAPFTSVGFLFKPMIQLAEVHKGVGNMVKYALTNNPSTFNFKKLINSATPVQRASMRSLFNSLAFWGSVAFMGNIYIGYKDHNLRGTRLLKYALESVTPPNPSNDWSTSRFMKIGNYRFIGYRGSALMAIMPQRMKIRIGGQARDILSGIPAAYGGVINYAMNRIGPLGSKMKQLREGRHWSGAEILADNGWSTVSNAILFIVSIPVPLTVGSYLENVHGQGPPKAWFDNTPWWAKALIDTENKPTWSQDFFEEKEFFSNLLGLTKGRETATGERQNDAMSWMATNYPDQDIGLSFSYWDDLDDLQRAEFDEYEPELADKVKEETAKKAALGFHNYDIYDDLNKNDERFLNTVGELGSKNSIVSQLYNAGLYEAAMKAKRGTISYDEATALLGITQGQEGPKQAIWGEKQYFEEKSRLMNELDIEPKEEPKDRTSQEHARWEYQKIVNEAVQKTEVKGDPLEEKHWTFDFDKYEESIRAFREKLTSEGRGEQWDYIQSQRNLIRRRYSEEAQAILSDMEEINTTEIEVPDTSSPISDDEFMMKKTDWWSLMDKENFLKHFILIANKKWGENEKFANKAQLSKYMDAVEDYLEISSDDKDGFIQAQSDVKMYTDIHRLYNDLATWQPGDPPSKKSGPGYERYYFIEKSFETSVVAPLLHKYGYNFPGKSKYDKYRESLKSRGLTYLEYIEHRRNSLAEETSEPVTR